MASLNLSLQLLAYEDTPLTSAPLQRAVDWKRNFPGLQVNAPGRVSVPPIPAGGSATVFNGTRTLTLDGTTAFALTLNALNPDQYFLTWTGGTHPGFRIDRGLTLSGSTLSITPQANASVLFTVTAGGGVFTGLQAGDQVFIPGLSTGAVAGPFNVTNEGLWVVLQLVDAADVILVRPSGSTLGYFAQTGVVLSANPQFQGFSAAGVQPGDSVDISAGISSPSSLLSTFEVLATTAQQLTFTATAPLPLVTGFTPTAAGLVVYSEAFNFLYIEADQQVAVQANGDTGQTQRLGPWDANGCPCGSATSGVLPGMYLKTGPTWELVIVNRSVNTVNLTVIAAQ